MSHHRKEGLHLKMELDQYVLMLKFFEGLLGQNRKELYTDTFAMSKLSDTGLASGSSVRLRFLLTVCSKADFLGKRCKSSFEPSATCCPITLRVEVFVVEATSLN